MLSSLIASATILHSRMVASPGAGSQPGKEVAILSDHIRRRGSCRGVHQAIFPVRVARKHRHRFSQALQMMRKGQVKSLDKSDAVDQAKFIMSLFGIASMKRRSLVK